MLGNTLIVFFQALGRIPGLQFMQFQADKMTKASLTLRSKKERAQEFKMYAEDARDTGKNVIPGGGEGGGKGGGKGGKGGAVAEPGRQPRVPGMIGRPSPAAGGSGGYAAHTGQKRSGDRLRGGQQKDDPKEAEQPAKRLRDQITNTDRLRQEKEPPPPSGGRPQDKGRLRRRDYDL